MALMMGKLVVFEGDTLKGMWGTYHDHSDMHGVPWEGIQAPILTFVSDH